MTRVATHGAAGSVPISPAFFGQLRRADADVMILHEPNPWALLAYAAVRPRAPLAIWFHSEVVRPALTYALFYNPVARPAYRAARRFIVASPAARRARGCAAAVPESHQRDSVSASTSTAGGRRKRSSGAPQRCEREAGRPIVLFAGRHVPYKGVDVLIRAAASLPVDVVLLGDGRMRREWEALAAAQAGPARYTFRGEVDDEEMRAWLAAQPRHGAAIGDPRRGVRLRAARGDGLRHARDQHDGQERRAMGQRKRPGGGAGRRRGAARGHRHDSTDDALAARVGAAGEARARSEFSMSRMAERFVAVCTAVAADA